MGSCRTYRPEPIAAGQQRLLAGFMATNAAGPLGSRARFALVAAAPSDLEDYGYLLERVVLYATGLGLGTCWLGGTFTRSSFVRRFGGLERGETMPAVVSIGLIGDDGSERIREREEGSRRLPPSELFFEQSFDEPRDLERAGGYADA